MPLSFHMGAEPQTSFEGVARGPPHGKLTTRHHRLSYYVSPNQSCRVFGDFGQKKLTNFKTRLWTRDTCHVSSEGTMSWALSSR